ncbi:hypothetical protein H072_9065 [Dactylellina haptotyla CBS 200.50]|uniref:Carbohydrate kinase PfkB domain-containing protein n=1 Tax=Dactylellina haptotyla (strain CBS 200.50) TaxID=1284197 RepID=S8BDI9_DACHA|nr:hypothetical protein H072_9065 [Dactylellina haptotyla CBS 200.50]
MSTRTRAATRRLTILNSEPLSVAIIGTIGMDSIHVVERMPENGESLNAISMRRLPGGKGANTAIAVCRASRHKPIPGDDADQEGEEVAGETRQLSPGEIGSNENNIEINIYMNGSVGNDKIGRILKANLVKHDIDVSGVQVCNDDHSTTCNVFVDQHTGQSRNLGYPGATPYWRPSEKDSVNCLAAGKRPDLVVVNLGISRQVAENIIKVSHRKGVDTILNASPAMFLLTTTYRSVTHLLLNESEAATMSGNISEEFSGPSLWERAAKYFIDLGVKYVVIILSKNEGAYYATQEGTTGQIEPEKLESETKDTTGARSTFVGTYVVECLRAKRFGEWDIEKAIRRAYLFSTRAVTELGAQESIPWADEIDS